MLKRLLLFLSIALLPLHHATARFYHIQVNQARELDSLNTKQIFKIRESMLKEYPILKQEKEDSSKIAAFYLMKHKSPWVGVKGSMCYGGNSSLITEGVSAESRFIDNPFALIGIEENNTLNLLKNKGNCPSSYFYLKKLSYDDETKTFDAIYNISDHIKNIKKFSIKKSLIVGTSFNGLNAHAFNINYAKAVKMRNIVFETTPNISTNVFKFKDYIFFSTTCKYRNGCNISRSYQAQLSFKTTKLPADITFHLWRLDPLGIETEPDIIFNIHIE